MRKEQYRDWLAANLERTGKSQSDLARHLGIEPGKVNKVLHGTRKLQLHEYEQARVFFGIEDDEDRPNVDLIIRSKFLSAPVVGKVEAGAFREVDELEDDSERLEIVVPADDKFPSARVTVFDVVGDSMNALAPRPILEGDRVVCVAYEDVGRSLPLRDGMVVVVERSRDGGHTREWSVKQLEVYEDRVECHPRSHNSRHKPIVIDRDLEADDGVSVRILAIVRRVVNDIPLS